MPNVTMNRSLFASLVVSCTLILCASAQQTAPDAPHAIKRKPQINWLYGSYVPKDVPLTSLSNRERFQLFAAQSFLTPGIYVKTVFLAGTGQLNNSPSEWGDGTEGFGKRLASNHAQSLIQNSLSSFGNALLRYEPRYDRCRCEDKAKRARHALMRNFLTYNATERELRPQIPLYAAAVSAGLMSHTWLPDNHSAWSRAGRNVVIQIGFGSLSNLAAEFAPDFKELFRRRKPRKEPTKQTN